MSSHVAIIPSNKKRRTAQVNSPGDKSVKKDLGKPVDDRLPPSKHLEGLSPSSSYRTPVLRVERLGHGRTKQALNVKGFKRKTPVAKGLAFSSDSQSFSDAIVGLDTRASGQSSKSKKKLSSPVTQGFRDINQALRRRRAKDDSPDLTAVVCLNALACSPSFNKMKKRSLTSPKVADDPPKMSPNSKVRSHSPRKALFLESPSKARSPRKKTEDISNDLNLVANIEKSNSPHGEKCVEGSSGGLSPRAKVRLSPKTDVPIQTEAIQSKELSPRELDAIKTLRKLKSRSPQKKAITNEMRKTACHSKQNERRELLLSSQQNISSNISYNAISIPQIQITGPKGKKKNCESPRSSKRQQRNVTKPVSTEVTGSALIKHDLQQGASPKKRGRKKKSLSSPEKVKSSSELSLSPASKIPYETGDSLKVEQTRSTKRVRSPSARYKKDIIMYPWDSPRKRQSPRKSPVDKNTACRQDVTKEFLSSASEESSSPESGDDDSENSITGNNYDSRRKVAQTVSRDNILSAAKVLNFDEVEVNEYCRIGVNPHSIDEYKSFIHTQEKNSADLIGLSDLIGKVSCSVEKPNEQLIDLFGFVEEPDYCDENVTFKPEDEDHELKPEQDTNHELKQEQDTKENNNQEPVQETEVKQKECVDTLMVELDSKSKTDSDLDSTLEYKNEDMNMEEMKMEPSISHSIERRPSNEMLKSDTCESSYAANNELINRQVQQTSSNLESHDVHDLNSDDKECRNVFDLFSDNDIEEQSNSVCVAPTCANIAAFERKSEKLDPVLTGTVENNHAGTSFPVQSNDKTTENSSDCIPVVNDLKSASIDHDMTDADLVELDNANNHDENTASESKMSDSKEVLLQSEERNAEHKPNVNKIDRSGYEQLRSSPRCVPRLSTVRKNFSEPSPLTVLKLPEKEITDKKCAFISQDLDDYMKPYIPEVDIEIENTEDNFVTSDKTNKKDMKEEPQEPPIPFEKEPSQRYVDTVVQTSNTKPDFDEIDNLLFVSFSSEEAMAAHIELEKKLDWLDETNLKRMTHLMNKEKTNENDATSAKPAHGKHSLRGVPGRIVKYHKLLQQELEIILKANENRIPVNLRTKTPEKTADITKIKGWKKKYTSTEELQKATGLHFSEAGKLHWRTEERILKQLEPEDVKEIGLDLKKKRRKLVHYTKRKGDSKTDKPKHSKAVIEEEGPLPLETVDNPAIDYDGEISEELGEKLPYHVKYFSQHKYGKRKVFVKQMKMNTEDENILKKLGSQKIAREQSKKENAGETKLPKVRGASFVIKLSHSMVFAALSALDKRLISRAKAIAKQKAKKRAMKAKSVTENIKVEALDDKCVSEVKDKLESDSQSDFDNSDDYAEISKEEVLKASSKDSRKRDEISERGDNDSKAVRTGSDNKEKPSPSKSCDKPGCRYGCICHLCKFSDEGEKEDYDTKPPCDKEYCRLGCICDSIETKTEDQSHCRKPGCIFGCKCKTKVGEQEPVATKTRERRKSKDEDQKRGKKRSKKKKKCHSRKSSVDERDTAELVAENNVARGNNSDWEPPTKRKRDNKKTPAANKFASLPRREPKYREAKNLDAVTRKAKQVYESSEMFVEQRVRRRKSDPVIEMVSDGDFLDLPPDWRDSLEPSSSGDKTTIPREEPDGGRLAVASPELNLDSDVMDVSDDDSDGGSPGEELTCARTQGYSGQRKSEKQTPIVIPDSEDTQKEKRDRVSKKKDTVIIDLVDSDCEVTEIRKEKTQNKPREMTASEKLKLLRKAQKKGTEDPKESAAIAAPSASEPKWKTQMVCLKAKKKASENQSGDESEIKLLEIISNCNWEIDRANMLSKISHIISREESKPHVVLWNNYALQFLPKADKPAVIPPELQSKLPNAMYSIRVRVTQNLNDIEQAENGTSKDGDADNLGDNMGHEGVNNLSDKERQQYASLRIQKKLIDKIRFAEKLKDTIEQEERKGFAPSKFSISKEGIEKALKRYKTQLWRAYTGNSNMSLSQLREAVMKAKSSNYTEKINQAISAIEKRAQEANTPESSEPSQSNTNFVAFGNLSALSKAAVFGNTSILPRTMLSGSDVKTLSSTAKARIEANQGIVIRGNTPLMTVPKTSNTRLLLVPVSTAVNSEATMMVPGLQGKSNTPVAGGTANLVNLQSHTGSTVAFHVRHCDSFVGSSVNASTTNIPSTSTSAPVVVSTAGPRISAPLTGPSVVTTLCTPVMSNLGAPRIFRPVSGPQGSTPVRMPVQMVNGQSENTETITTATKIVTPVPKSVLFSGRIKGQRVLLRSSPPCGAKTLNLSVSSNPCTATVSSSTIISSVSETLCTSSENGVIPVSENGEHKLAVQKVDQEHSVSPSPLVSTTDTLSGTCVTGAQTGSISNPFYPPVRFVAANSGHLPGKFVPVSSSSQVRLSGKVAVIPQSISASGARHMVPLRVFNPACNTPNAVVQLIPASSTSFTNSGNSAHTSVPNSTAGFIAVPVHFGKPPILVTSESSATVTQSQHIPIPPTGIKTCELTMQRSVSPAAGIVSVCPVKNAEAGSQSTSKSPVAGFQVTQSDHHEDAVECEKVKKKKRSCGSNHDSEHIGSSDTQLKQIPTKRRKKSYAEKLEDLNNLGNDQNIKRSCTSSVAMDSENVSASDKISESMDCIMELHASKSADNETKNDSSSDKLCEDLSNDMIDLSKNLEDVASDISESVQDDGNQLLHHKSNVERDSVDGDINFEHSSGTQSESGESSTVNIDAVIDNTKNAGLQIASALGNTLDSPDIAAVVKGSVPKNSDCLTYKSKLEGSPESEIVSNGSSVTSNADNSSHASDGCLVIDENYISPVKHKSGEIQDNINDKLVKETKDSDPNAGCHSQEIIDADLHEDSNTIDSKSGDDELQICLEDSEVENEMDIDIESLDGNPSTSSSSNNEDSSIQKSPKHLVVITQDSTFSATVDFKPVTQKKRACEKLRRREMKKQFSTLAKQVLMYNPNVKKKFIKFLNDSTVQLPKVLILNGAKDLIDMLHEEYQCLHELQIDGEQYQESLKKKLQLLTEHFVEKGIPEVVVQNFLKGVASSARYMRNNAEEDSVVQKSVKGFKSSSRYMKNDTEEDSGKVRSETGSKISLVDLTAEDVDGFAIVDTATASGAEKPVKSSFRESFLKSKSSAVPRVCVVENDGIVRAVYNDPIISCSSSILKDIRNSLGEEVENESGSCHGDENLDGSSASKNLCDSDTQASERYGDSNSRVQTIDLTDEKNVQAGHDFHKINDSQEKCDRQTCVSNYRTSQSNEASSQSSNQSDKIVLMDSAMLEDSADRINHSELFILDDSDNEEEGEVHHLDEILDEWSAEICSQKKPSLVN